MSTKELPRYCLDPECVHEREKKGGACATCGCHVCTPELPYAGDGRGIHPYAKEVGEQENGYPGGDIVTMACSICGVRWKKELPQ